MALTTAEIADEPTFHALVQEQSRNMLALYGANPRLSAVFATQQRWLMAHLGLALYFRNQPDGLSVTRFLDAVRAHAVASPNTADAFIKEMLSYDFILRGKESSDRRVRPLYPASIALAAVEGWLLAHLATLDGIDGARRLPTFRAAPEALAGMQPHICDGLLSAGEVREPKDTFSLFTWLNSGGIIMDRLIAGMQPAGPGAECIPTDIGSLAEIGTWLNLSRTHLARKLREAENLGSIGWTGKRGRSAMWVSTGFRREYLTAQAVKLAVIDRAYQTVFGTP